jgi:hypothetical protein
MEMESSPAKSSPRRTARQNSFSFAGSIWSIADCMPAMRRRTAAISALSSAAVATGASADAWRRDDVEAAMDDGAGAGRR